MINLEKNKNIYLLFFIAVVLQVIWGFTPIASKYVIDKIPIELYITLRWTISGFIFWAILIISGSWKPLKHFDILAIAVLGLAGYGFASFGTLYGLKIGGIANFALTSSFGPIISSIFSIIFLKEVPQKKFYVALPLSILGLTLIVFGKYQISSIDIAVVGALVILFAYICDALVFVYSKKYKSKISTIQYLAIAQTATALCMWFSQVIYFNQTDQIRNLNGPSLYGLIFVSIVSCVLCFYILYWLLNFIDGHRLALFDGLHSVSAIFFAFVIFNEQVDNLMLVGGVLILGAIFLGNYDHVISKKKA